MDASTLIGVFSGILLIMGAILVASNVPLVFVDVGSFIVTIGGAIAALFVGFPLGKIKPISKVVKNAFVFEERSPVDLIDSLVRYAEIARRDGILALEGQAGDIDDEFLVKGIQLAVDGTDPELIYQTMTTELDYVQERHGDGQAIFSKLGAYTPAFGMVGTLIGLVAMLAELDDPSAIGAGMAIALITTFYGAVFANLFFLPIADKLSIRSKEEALLKEIVIRGVMSIQSGDNPRIVAQKLKIYLPPQFRTEPDAAA